LADCGGGFDWAASDESRLWWVNANFRVDGAFVEPLAVHLLAGRVSFASCLRGREVRAEGVCRPTVPAGSAESWRLSVEVPLTDSSGLTDEHRTVEAGTERAATVVLQGWAGERWLADSVPGAEVLVRLPYREGLIVGAGRVGLSPDTTAVRVVLDEGIVLYVQ
jgi:hypothetical protein